MAMCCLLSPRGEEGLGADLELASDQRVVAGRVGEDTGDRTVNLPGGMGAVLLQHERLAFTVIDPEPHIQLVGVADMPRQPRIPIMGELTLPDANVGGQ